MPRRHRWLFIALTRLGYQATRTCTLSRLLPNLPDDARPFKRLHVAVACGMV